MEKFYVSKSGRYEGVIVGKGKFAQCLLDEKSKGKLASDNLTRVRKQNKPS